MARTNKQWPPKPELQEIEVSVSKLLLWPNNPRLFSRDMGEVRREDFIDPGIQNSLVEEMKQGSFRLEDLKESFRQNGYMPIDYVFVQHYDDKGHYVVLEGNRRITAIRQLLQEEDLAEGIRKELESINCMEIINELPEREMRELISYLLGLRHHGALKPWSRFARAANMVERYYHLAEQEPATFCWEPEVGEDVARSLGIRPKEVREGTATYRVMKQLGNVETIREAGGIQGNHYSLIHDSVVKGAAELREYCPMDTSRFELSEEAIARLDELCHFSRSGDKNAPIAKPADWTQLAKILRDDDLEKRRENLRRVSVDKESPRDVWADRERELKRDDWTSWLQQVLAIVSRIELGGITGSVDEKHVVSRLTDVLKGLETVATRGGASHA